MCANIWVFGDFIHFQLQYYLAYYTDTCKKVSLFGHC